MNNIVLWRFVLSPIQSNSTDETFEKLVFIIMAINLDIFCWTGGF